MSNPRSTNIMDEYNISHESNEHVNDVVPHYLASLITMQAAHQGTSVITPRKVCMAHE